MRAEALKLANEIGVSGEHPDYPVLGWQDSVSNCETREGYWDWVWSEMRYDNHAWIEAQN